MTCIIQLHGWRGFSADRDLMDCMFVVGFVTLYVSRRPLLDKIVKLLRAAKAEQAARHTN